MHCRTQANARHEAGSFQALRIQWLYLPTYSPNLTLIERLWKFLKRKVARNRFYPTFADFRAAV